MLSAGPLAQVVGTSAANRYGPVADPVAALTFQDTAALLSILPTEADARLLAHVREVNQADSELAGTDDDGWIAVVVGNRLVTESGASNPDTVWRATLVSLEFRDDIAARSPQTASVLALATWEFTSTATGAFQDLVASLKIDAFGGIEGDAYARTHGARLVRTDRGGTSGPARYRSPMSPELAAAAEPVAGEPDVTALAASELGRLVAAADGRLLRELVQWRRSSAIDSARAVNTTLVAHLATRVGPAAARAGSSVRPGAAAPAGAAQADAADRRARSVEAEPMSQPVTGYLAAAVQALREVAAGPAMRRATPVRQPGVSVRERKP